MRRTSLIVLMGTRLNTKNQEQPVDVKMYLVGEVCRGAQRPASLHAARGSL